jgi:hypothetical protein
MKLANMGSVGNERLQEMGYPGARDDEEGLPEEEAVEPGLEPEEGPPEEEVPGLEPELEPEEGEGEMSPELEDMLIDAIKAIAKAWDMEDIVSTVQVPDEDEGVPEGEPEELELGLGELEPAGPPEEPEELDVPPAMQEALINKVARRVAKRLMKENKNEKLANDLTERIFNRITSN